MAKNLRVKRKKNQIERNNQKEQEIKSIEDELKESNPDATIIKELPSKFIPYDVDEILIRRLKVKEVKLLSRLGQEPSIETILKAHKNAIINIDAEKLVPVDFKAVSIIIATVTEPSFRITTGFNCPNPECKHFEEPIIKSLTIEDIKFEELEQEVFEYQDLKFYPIRMRDLIFFEKFEQKIKDKLDDYSEDDQTLVILTLAYDPGIADNNNIKRFIEVYENIIGDLPYDKKLDEIADKVLPDIEPYKTPCPECGSEISVILNLDYNRIYL